MRISDWSSDVCSSDLAHDGLDDAEYWLGCMLAQGVKLFAFSSLETMAHRLERGRIVRRGWRIGKTLAQRGLMYLPAARNQRRDRCRRAPGHIGRAEIDVIGEQRFGFSPLFGQPRAPVDHRPHLLPVMGGPGD